MSHQSLTNDSTAAVRGHSQQATLITTALSVEKVAIIQRIWCIDLYWLDLRQRVRSERDNTSSTKDIPMKTRVSVEQTSQKSRKANWEENEKLEHDWGHFKDACTTNRSVFTCIICKLTRVCMGICVSKVSDWVTDWPRNNTSKPSTILPHNSYTYVPIRLLLPNFVF